MNKNRSLFVQEKLGGGQLALRLLKYFVLAYASLWLISRAVLAFVVDPAQITDVPYHGEAAYLFVLSFFVFFTPLLYLFNCLLARQWLRPHWRTLALYMGATFACGVFCEVLFDSAFVQFIWIENRYTSIVFGIYNTLCCQMVYHT